MGAVYRSERQMMGPTFSEEGRTDTGLENNKDLKSDGCTLLCYVKLLYMRTTELRCD